MRRVSAVVQTNMDIIKIATTTSRFQTRQARGARVNTHVDRPADKALTLCRYARRTLLYTLSAQRNQSTAGDRLRHARARETDLSPRFKNNDSDTVGEIDAAVTRLHRNLQMAV
jgi:hypothetical protein